MTSHSDQLAAVQLGFAGLVRALWPQFSGSPQLGRAAKTAGLSAAQVRQYLDGQFTPPPHQGVVLALALVDQMAASRASLMQTITATPPLPAWETSEAGALAEAKAIAKAHPGWEITPEGAASLGTDHAKVIWKARRTDEQWADVNGVTASELRSKLEQIDRHREYAAEQEQRYLDGRGTGKLVRSMR